MPARVRMRRTVGRPEVDAFQLAQQLGEVGVVGALIALGGQFYHRGSLRWRYGVVGTAATVAVGEGSSSLTAVGRQQPGGRGVG